MQPAQYQLILSIYYSVAASEPPRTASKYSSSEETTAWLGFPIPTTQSFTFICSNNWSHTYNCLYFLEISVEIDQDNSSMVDGDNIDEVRILLPEDKIQVCIMYNVHICMQVLIHYELKRVEKCNLFGTMWLHRLASKVKYQLFFTFFRVEGLRQGQVYGCLKGGIYFSKNIDNIQFSNYTFFLSLRSQ